MTHTSIPVPITLFIALGVILYSLVNVGVNFTV